MVPGHWFFCFGPHPAAAATTIAIEINQPMPPGYYKVKIAEPHVKPEPNTDDRIRSPRFTFPCLRQ